MDGSALPALMTRQLTSLLLNGRCSYLSANIASDIIPLSERDLMLQKFVKTVGGNPHRRQLEQLSEEIEQINALEAGV